MKINVFHFLALSIFLHMLISAFFYFNKQDEKQKVAQVEKGPLKILSIRNVGKEESKIKNSVYLPPEIKTQKQKAKPKTLKGNEDKISFSDLRPNSQIKFRSNEDVRPKSAMERLKSSQSSVRNFLKSSNQKLRNSGELAELVGNNNVLVKLEVPEGVPEDELNQYELVFYSFRKRIALNYINSFYNRLSGFAVSNPHLSFPMTDKEQTLTGRITYDKEGNITKIRMLRWSNTQELQDFFLDVLKEMNALPNPPKIIVKNDEFHVYYSLTLNKSL